MGLREGSPRQEREPAGFEPPAGKDQLVCGRGQVEGRYLQDRIRWPEGTELGCGRGQVEGRDLRRGPGQRRKMAAVLATDTQLMLGVGLIGKDPGSLPASPLCSATSVLRSAREGLDLGRGIRPPRRPD